MKRIIKSMRQINRGLKFHTLASLASVAFLLSSCNNAQLKEGAGNTSAIANQDSAAIAREIRDQAKPAYVEAYKKVMGLKTAVSLAETGDRKAAEVVNEYNTILGPEMGKLKTLRQVTERLDSAGEAYIQFKFDKAAADIARTKAAEAQFDSGFK